VNAVSTSGRGSSRAVVVIAIAAALRLVFAALIPAFPDETYYWDWSRHLATGYFDHPPAIAWLIALGASLSKTAFGIRFGPVLAGFVAALATIGTARRLGGNDAALRAAIIISVLPLAAAGLILATPDAPLLAAISVALYCVVRMLESAPRSRDSLVWWIAAGVAIGIAFWSKYTSIFFPLAVVLAVVIHPALRVRLREPGPYVAVIVATIVFLPVLYWNSQHEWISFVYQIRHGLEAPSGSALKRAWRFEGDFFGGQAGLASPVLFIMLGIAVARSLSRRVDEKRFMLAVIALASFGFFVYSATRRRVEPNWPAPAYIPAVVLLATMPLGASAKKWLDAGILFAAVMSALIYVQGVVPVLPIKPSKDPIARAHGWADASRRVDSIAAATGGTTWLGGDRYQEASELAFHTAARPTFAVNLAGRPNQYDLWPRFPDVARVGDNLVLLVDDDDGGVHGSVKSLMPFFASAVRSALVELRRGGAVIGTRRVWVLSRWRGQWPRRDSAHP
jgi:4-amino-4-deoxy-L-arabinose transferase-like glycosyltransferase